MTVDRTLDASISKDTSSVKVLMATAKSLFTSDRYKIAVDPVGVAYEAYTALIGNERKEPPSAPGCGCHVLLSAARVNDE